MLKTPHYILPLCRKCLPHLRVVLLLFLQYLAVYLCLVQGTVIGSQKLSLVREEGALFRSFQYLLPATAYHIYRVGSMGQVGLVGRAPAQHHRKPGLAHDSVRSGLRPGIDLARLADWVFPCSCQSQATSDYDVEAQGNTTRHTEDTNTVAMNGRVNFHNETGTLLAFPDFSDASLSHLLVLLLVS